MTDAQAVLVAVLLVFIAGFASKLWAEGCEIMDVFAVIGCALAIGYMGGAA